MTPEELAELDLAVAKAEGYTVARLNRGRDACLIGAVFQSVYEPRNPKEAMRLLEKYKLHVSPDLDGFSWVAQRRQVMVAGPTPAIAICRAVVALSKQPTSR